MRVGKGFLGWKATCDHESKKTDKRRSEGNCPKYV